MLRAPWFATVVLCLSSISISTLYTDHGAVLGLIQTEFHLSASEASLMSTVFFAAAAITMLIGGVIADRKGPRNLLTACFAVVVLANLGMGFLSPTFAALLAFKALAGLGSGAGFAAGTSYARGIFAGWGSHLAQGIYGASFLVGSALTAILMPVLAGPLLDWRRAFGISGVGIALVWVLWATLSRPDTTPRRTRPGNFGDALRDRNIWVFSLCHMCGFGLAMVLGTWAILFLVQRFGLPLALAGAVGSLPLVTGIFARFIGGVLLEKSFSPARIIQVSLILSALGMFVLAAAGASGLLWLAVFGLVAAGLGTGTPFAAVFNGAAASVPGSPGLAQAIVGLNSILLTILAAPLVGVLLDVTGSFSAGFATLGVITVGALGSTLLLHPFSLTTHPPKLSPPSAAIGASVQVG